MIKMVFMALLSVALLQAQESNWDSLNIQYDIVRQEYTDTGTILTLDLPPYLDESELIRQIKMAVWFPGEPEPTQKIEVIIRAEGPKQGRKAGKVYFRPGRGFDWKIDKWQQDTTMYTYRITAEDRLLYDTVLDSMYSTGAFSIHTSYDAFSRAKKHIARHFNLKMDELVAAYFRVKWWGEIEKRRQQH